jgi:hypothetical protein
MHQQDIKLNTICFGTEQFNHSLKELKENLHFNIDFHSSFSEKIIISKCSLLIIDGDILDTPALEKIIKNIDNKIKLLISTTKQTIKINQKNEIKKPFNIVYFNNKVLEALTINKFNQNSSIKIKNFILDKNEKKLILVKDFITITEKEIQLLEILFDKKKPLSKKYILNQIWKYASNVDTHTVETHVYRLRKKIIQKFNIELIKNNKNGYSI